MTIEVNESEPSEKLTDEEKISRILGKMPDEEFNRWVARLFGRAHGEKRKPRSGSTSEPQGYR